MAEIKAQCGDQRFVDRVFSQDRVIETISVLRSGVMYRSHPSATFIDACAVLAQAVADENLSNRDRRLCGRLLRDRLLKSKDDGIATVLFPELFQNFSQNLVLSTEILGGLDER